jgi:CDP-glycerol glycerophosphotransferase (TagB/SpsB family)/glycerophosphoryl diester phosphodiesterase
VTGPLAGLCALALRAGRWVVRQLVALPVGLAGRVVPRDPALWAFGSTSGRRFADNPKHLFLHCHSADGPGPKVRAVWLSQNRDVVRAVRALGLPAEHCWHPRGLWTALRAGVYLFDCRALDVHPSAGHGAFKVNLWHGVPLKKIECDIEQADHPIVRARRGSRRERLAARLLRPQFTERYDRVLATAGALVPRFAGAFDVRPDQVLVAGYPRNDPLRRRGPAPLLADADRAVCAELAGERARGRRVLLYMPTFRDWNNGPDRRLPLDWAALDAALARHGGVLYCKLHPNDRSSLPALDGCPRVRLLPGSADVYPLLAHTDALISDYSSIFFDYLLVDRPILFYAYDLEEYQRLSRSLYEPYAAVTPGAHATTADQLTARVTELLADYDAVCAATRAARAEVRARYFDHADDRSAARLTAMLAAELGLADAAPAGARGADVAPRGARRRARGRAAGRAAAVLVAAAAAAAALGCATHTIDGPATPSAPPPVAAPPPTAAERFVAPGDSLVLVAHRGYMAVHPENTVPAIAAAFDRGADGVEIDLRLTRDSATVIMHDVTVDRTTTGVGRVADLTAAQVRALDACSRFRPRVSGTTPARWAPCPVPTLDEALAAAAGRGLVLLHVYGPYPSWAVARMLAAVRQAGMEQSVVVLAFEYDVLRAVRDAAPSLPLGVLSYTVAPPKDAHHYRPAAAISNLNALLTGSADSARAWRARASELGVAVAAYAPATQADARALVGLGVTRLIVDLPLDRPALAAAP